MNPLFLELSDFRDDRKPSPSSQEWIFIQTLTAAPSGPHVSGAVIQASDKTPRSTHWFSDESVTTAFLTWYKDLRVEICIPIYLSHNEHIDLPFPGWTHWFTFPWKNILIYLSLEEHSDLPFRGPVDHSYWLHFWPSVPVRSGCRNYSKAQQGVHPRKQEDSHWLWYYSRRSLLFDSLEQFSQYIKFQYVI